MAFFLKSFGKCNRTLLLFLTLFIISIVFCIIFHSSEMYYDSRNYWTLGKSVWKGGDFNVIVLASVRGYLFPFLLSFCSFLPGYYGWYLFISLLLSLTYGLILPKFFSSKVDKKCCISSICALLLTLLLFKGLFVYVLSDFPALFFSIAAIYFFRLYMDNLDKKTVVKIALLISTGLFLYLSYNIRTIYFVSAIIVIVIAIVFSLKRNNNSRCSYVLFFLFVGVVIAALPQIYVNNLFYDRLSIQVPVSFISEEINEQLLMIIPYKDLNNAQLTWGFYCSRYDTSIDPEFGVGGLAFSNGIGRMIMEREEIESIDSLVDYLVLWTKYPIELTSMYFDHFINMLVSYYPEIYIKHVSEQGLFFLTVGYSLIYLFIVTFKYNRNKKLLILLLPLVSTVLVLSLGAVEYRFSLGLYFIIVVSLCYNVEWRNIWDNKQKKMLLLIIPYVIGLIALISSWASVLAEYDIWLI